MAEDTRTMAEAGIELHPDLTRLGGDAGKVLERAGMYAVIQLNESSIWAHEKPVRAKLVGNLTTARMTDILCRCGCRLKTDGSLYWCSGIRCGFVGKEETF